MNKTVAELKELVKNQEITIYSSCDPESDKINLSIFHYNANYENRFKVIEWIDKIKDEIYRSLNDSGFIGFLNTAIIKIIKENQTY